MPTFEAKQVVRMWVQKLKFCVVLYSQQDRTDPLSSANSIDARIHDRKQMELGGT
jgi:hypothetical protein